ncbi:MAG: ATP-binding protein [Candidatus Thorarchaeota archaeon]
MTESNLESLNFSEFIKDVLIFIDKDICNGCGLCAEVCPFGLPQANSSGKYEISRPELCTECSACKRNCPVQAIILNERKGCGCLWNARGVAKNAKKGNTAETSCGCGPTSENNVNNSCCG